jgi:hypothetical protein
MTTDFSRVFTLEVDGRPTLSFEASNTRQADKDKREMFDRLLRYLTQLADEVGHAMKADKAK